MGEGGWGSKKYSVQIPVSRGVRPVTIAGMIVELYPSKVSSGRRLSQKSSMKGRSSTYCQANPSAK